MISFDDDIGLLLLVQMVLAIVALDDGGPGDRPGAGSPFNWPADALNMRHHRTHTKQFNFIWFLTLILHLFVDSTNSFLFLSMQYAFSSRFVSFLFMYQCLVPFTISLFFRSLFEEFLQIVFNVFSAWEN